MRRSRKPVRVFRSDEGSNPSLSVSCQVRAFLPAYLRIARRHWSFRLRLPRDFSTAAPCPSPVGPPRGRDQGAGRKTDASRPHSIATTSKSPPLLEGPYACPPAYLRREDVLGAHFPRPVPSSTPVRAAAGPAATNQSSRAAHSSAPGRPRLSDTGSATVGGMAAALMLATFRLLASTAPRRPRARLWSARWRQTRLPRIGALSSAGATCSAPTRSGTAATRLPWSTVTITMNRLLLDA
jgi:hypothetical protein